MDEREKARARRRRRRRERQMKKIRRPMGPSNHRIRVSTYCYLWHRLGYV